MTDARRLPLIELTLMAAVLASLGFAVTHFLEAGYLPQPFVLDTNDTFMDWFNTAFWANRPGAYDVWRSIYPPLSFVFLDLFSMPGCYLSSPFHARDCDWFGRATIYAFYLIDVALLWIAFRRNDRRTAVPRTVAMALGLPLLFTLERGNLILAGLACFIIAHGPIVRSTFWRHMATAATLNFKPYLIVPVLALVIRRDWRALELAGIATVALYLVTLAIVGSGSLGELASNMANWVTFVAGQPWNEVNYSTSYAPLLLIGKAVPLLQFVPSRLVETISWIVPVVIRTAQALALFVAVAAWFQPRALTHARLAAILMAAYLVTQSPGGYTQIFLLFLVLLEPWKGAGPKIAITACYLLCLIGDLPISTILDIDSNSWLSGRAVSPSFGLTVGHFVRPGLVVVILWALALDSLIRIVRAHAHHRPNPGLVIA